MTVEIDARERQRGSRTMTRRDLVKGAAAAGAAVPASRLLGQRVAGAAPARIAARQAKPASLNMLYATVEADVEAIKLVMPDFKTETGVAINLDSQPYDALQQKVFSELASNSSYYDVIIVDTPWTPALAGKLEPLSGYLTNDAVNDVADVALTDFIEKVFFDTAVYNPTETHLQFPKQDAIDLAAIKSGGFDVFGLPLQANVLVAMYRTDLVDDDSEQAAFKQQTGSDLKFPETTGDFVTVAKFFTRPDKNLYGTTLMPGPGDWATDDFKTFLAAWGGDGHMITDDFKMAFNGPEGYASLGWYADLINVHKVTPPGVTSFSWDDAAAAFQNGLTAISMNYHTTALNPTVAGKIAYALVPKNKTRGPHFGAWMLSVNKYSNNKEWAYRAVSWLTSAKTQTKMLEAQLHPSRKSVYDAAKTDPAASKFGNFYDILGQSLALGVGRPRLTNYSAVDKEIWVAVNNAATGSAKPEDALKSAADNVTKLLKQAGYPVS
ncbi:MAG TPA: extracellular solute-binding protein [Thermomicrobiales bacterium]|nr:extracellular solute-binding protein [Thermomicrobiales bacterium]